MSNVHGVLIVGILAPFCIPSSKPKAQNDNKPEAPKKGSATQRRTGS